MDPDGTKNIWTKKVLTTADTSSASTRSTMVSSHTGKDRDLRLTAALGSLVLMSPTLCDVATRPGAYRRGGRARWPDGEERQQRVRHRADRDGVDQGADPDRAPESEAHHQDRDLEAGPHQTHRPAGTADQACHQAVTRSRSQRR